MNLKDLKTAVKAAKRLTGKAPAPLLHYQSAQFFLEQWRHKQKLANTKVRKYARIVARYEKKYQGGNNGHRS